MRASVVMSCQLTWRWPADSLAGPPGSWTQNYIPAIDHDRLSTKSAVELGLLGLSSLVDVCRD